MNMYQCLLENRDVIGLCVDIVSLLVGIALTIGIYLLERRHEKDREKDEQKVKQTATSEFARIFVIDNDEEIDYLPLAAIAAKLNLKRKHNRNLITRFMRCNENQQKEILQQTNTSDHQVSMEAAEFALECLQEDLEKHNFGINIFYEGSKYFHRAFERWSKCAVENSDPYIFEDIKATVWHDENSEIPWRTIDCKSSLYYYMEDYLHANEMGFDKSKPTPPISMVYKNCNLGDCHENIMTFWTMRIIIDACRVFKGSQYEDLFEIFDETLIKTQEDMYYFTLAILCKAYPQSGENNDKKKKQ